MKKVQLLLLVLFLIYQRASAQTADKTIGCVPFEVKFSAPVGSGSYYWDFKDGVSSNHQNPSNIFNNPGVYKVTLQENPSAPVLSTIQITVYPKPDIEISVPPLGCTPFSAEFKNRTKIDPALKITNYSWTFGDGGNALGIENPTHLYASPGKYSVSLGIETNYPTCNSTAVFKSVLETVTGPVASFSTTPSSTIVCDEPFTVSFNNTSSGSLPLKYTWDMGNGNTYTSSKPPNQTYRDGQFQVKLTVDYTKGNKCAHTYSKPIGVGKPKAEAFASTDTACSRIPVTLSTPSVGLIEWDLGSKAVFDTNDIHKNKIKVTYPYNGYVTAVLKVTSPDGLCFDRDTVQIFVIDLEANIPPGIEATCVFPFDAEFSGSSNQMDSDLTYTWGFTKDTNKYEQKNIAHTFTEPDTLISLGDTLVYFLASLTVTNSSGCVGGAINRIIYGKPHAIFTPLIHSYGCIPLDVTFVDKSKGNNWVVEREWFFGDGVSTLSDSIAVTYTYHTPGEYMAKLAVTNEYGCKDTSSAILIQVGDHLDESIVSLSADKSSVCPGDTVNFTASSTFQGIDGWRIFTENERTFHCSDQQTLSWTYSVEGPQDVSVKVDYNGCISTITKPGLVTVKGAVADIDYNALCSDPLNYNFISKSTQATNWDWQIADGFSANTDKVSHAFANSGAYAVSLTVSDPSSGCVPTTDKVLISARALKSVIDIDSLICINTDIALDASKSKDVFPTCHAGYTWQFPTLQRRPITTGENSVKISFGEAGNQILRLITHDINGCIDTVEKNFKVYAIKPDFTVDKNPICTPGTVQFTDLTTSDTTITAWRWSFSNGDTSIVKDPSYTFTSMPFNEKYWVTGLKVTDALGCTDFVNIGLGYYAPESIIQADTTICMGDTIAFFAPDFTSQGSHLAFNWDFGNGQTSTAQKNRIYYDTLRDYTVILNYEEITTGCKGADTTHVQIQSYPQAGISTNVDTLTILCAPKNITFKDSSQSAFPLLYAWDFGNGTKGYTKDYSLFYEKGNYTATHIVQTTFGCADTTTQAFQLFRPEGDFEVNKTAVCKGDSILFTLKDTVDVASFKWGFGDGTVLNDTAPVMHAYNFHPPSGNTIAKLVLTGVDGICPVSISAPITIYQVIADFMREDGIDTSICFNDGPYHFTNLSSGYDNMEWDFGDGQKSKTLHPAHQYAVPGTYLVSVAVSNNALGCPDTMKKYAVLYKNPVVSAVGDTVCQRDSLHLFVQKPVPTSKYVWTPSIGLLSNSIPVTAGAPLHTIFYTVTEIDTNQCAGFAEVPGIIVEPSGLHDWDTTIIIGDKVALPAFATTLQNFKWTPEDGLSCLKCDYPEVQPLKDISYTLDVTDALGCFSSSYIYNIYIRLETFVKLPTTFTPNGDGNNDVVYVKGWGIKDLLEFDIYNRWGQLIYRSADINQGWDGTFNGRVQNADVYVYKVKVRTWKEEVLHTEGYINLVH